MPNSHFIMIFYLVYKGRDRLMIGAGSMFILPGTYIYIEKEQLISYFF